MQWYLIDKQSNDQIKLQRRSVGTRQNRTGLCFLPVRLKGGAGVSKFDLEDGDELKIPRDLECFLDVVLDDPTEVKVLL